MKLRWIGISVGVLLVWALLSVTSTANERKHVQAHLTGFQEVPSISTTGNGEFHAHLSDTSIEFELSYSALEGGNAAAAHIHIGQRGVNGGVIAFLCGGGGKPACPALPSVTITGTIIPANIIGPAGQGIAPGEFAETLRAIRSGNTYVNVHNATYPGGEIRGQIRTDSDENPD